MVFCIVFIRCVLMFSCFHVLLYLRLVIWEGKKWWKENVYSKTYKTNIKNPAGLPVNPPPNPWSSPSDTVFQELTPSGPGLLLCSRNNTHTKSVRYWFVWYSYLVISLQPFKSARATTNMTNCNEIYLRNQYKMCDCAKIIKNIKIIYLEVIL